MKTILVPTDFSDNALNAIHYAAALGSIIRGKIILFHAMHEVMIANPEAPSMVQPGALLRDGYLSELEKISRTIRLENGFRFEVECACEPAPLYQSLSALVVQQQVDLVVMGTQGANSFVDKLMGTNTRIVMEDVNCPVLAIPANATFQGFKALTYASDFEKDEAPYLQQLLAITQPFNAQLQIVNIKTEDELDLVADGQIIADLAIHLKDQPYTVTQVLADSVAEGVQTYQKNNPTEVLAVALEKRSWWESFFHKSVSAELAYTSKIPFLSLPAQPYKKSVSMAPKRKPFATI